MTLIFLWLPSPELAIARVAQRVREGGHLIPKDVIVRRFHAGLRNMRRYYLPLADLAVIYDNSGRGRVLIAEREPAMEVVVHDAGRWQRIVEASL